MDNYTIVCLLLIAAGIVLGCVVLVNIKNRKKSGSTIEFKDERLNMSEVPPPIPDPDRIRTPINIIGRDVDRIYVYTESKDRVARRVWLCRDCETENDMRSEKCIVCGALKAMGGR